MSLLMGVHWALVTVFCHAVSSPPEIIIAIQWFCLDVVQKPTISSSLWDHNGGKKAEGMLSAWGMAAIEPMLSGPNRTGQRLSCGHRFRL